MGRHWWYSDDGGLVFEDRPTPRGEPEWRAMPDLLKEHEEGIELEWSSDLSAVEALRQQPVAGKPHVKGLSSRSSYPAGTAGQVMVTNESQGVAYLEQPYTAAELREIEQQGKTAPRMLNLVENRLASWNRKEAADLSRWLERTLPYARG